MLFTSRRFVNDVGPLQRRILIWAGFHSPGVTLALMSHQDLLNRVQAAPWGFIGPGGGSPLMEGALRAHEEELARIAAARAQGVSVSHDLKMLDSGRPWLKWSSSVVPVDDDAVVTASSISHALRKLSEKELLARHDATHGAGARRRTDEVRLTEEGAVLAVALIVAVADRDSSNVNIAAVAQRISPQDLVQLRTFESPDVDRD